MDALRTAQPIVNAVGRYMELALTDMSEALDDLVDKVELKIDEEYADVIRYQEALEDEKYNILAGLEEAMADELMTRLDRMNRIEEEIESDWTTYRATHRELDAIYTKVNAENRQVRLITLVWLRAHQKMASGIVNPAEWFDIGNAPAELFRLGSKAVF